MRTLAYFFLRAKHWQIFLFLVVLIVVAQVLSLLLDFGAHRSGPFPGLTALVYLIVLVLLLLFLFCFLGWFASVGFFLASITQPALNLKTGLFRFALLYPAVYLPLVTLALRILPTDGVVFMVIFLPHLLAMLCMFYNVYFVAKALVLAESAKRASFSDYALLFFLLWFFPIGIWMVQPRVNRLYTEGTRIVPSVRASTT